MAQGPAPGGAPQAKEATVSNTTDALAGADLRSIPLSEITVGDGFNPRSSFDAKALEDLTASVRQHGVLAPITVCSLEEGYRLIAGERRLRAAHNAGLGEIPALVRPVDTGLDGLDLALVENIAREDLDAVEEARAFQRLIDGGLTRKGVAERLSIAQKRVTERLAVLELPQALHAKVADGSIAPGAIRALVSLGKVHAELPQFAVAKIEAGPAHEWDEPLTYADLAEDPIRVVASDYEGEEAGLPAGVFETYSSYPIASFTLDEKAEGNLVKLAELRGFEPADFSVRFDRAELEAAEALGAAHQSKESFVGLIVGQEVADQLERAVSHLLQRPRGARSGSHGSWPGRRLGWREGENVRSERSDRAAAVAFSHWLRDRRCRCQLSTPQIWLVRASTGMATRRRCWRACSGLGCGRCASTRRCSTRCLRGGAVSSSAEAASCARQTCRSRGTWPVKCH